MTENSNNEVLTHLCSIPHQLICNILKYVFKKKFLRRIIAHLRDKKNVIEYN